MSDQETLGIYDAKAQEYAKITKTDADRAELAAFIEHVAPGGRILDLGCGPGHFAGRMAEHGLVVEATDASGEMVRIASQVAGVSARQETFDALDAVNQYDGIFANFSLLHAERAKVPDHVNAIAKALKSGGIFHIGMKIGDDESRDSIGRRYSYFTEAELEKMMNDNGLSVIWRSHGEDIGLSGEMAAWVVLQSKKA
ncbi:MAG: methyltransferase domain-containing protein [Planktotalea sp.]|uniref:class I SAM-dependent methyltransferase n=1 Tax=Planktotalea sp. TaxID=2029877 RepID=UPI003C70BFE5